MTDPKERTLNSYHQAKVDLPGLQTPEEIKRYLGGDLRSYVRDPAPRQAEWNRLDAAAEVCSQLDEELLWCIFTRPSALALLADNPALNPSLARRILDWARGSALTDESPENTYPARGYAMRALERLARRGLIAPDDSCVSLLVHRMLSLDGGAYHWNYQEGSADPRDAADRKAYFRILMSFPYLEEETLLRISKASGWVGSYDEQIARHPSATPAVWVAVLRHGVGSYALRALAQARGSYSVPAFAEALFDFAYDGRSDPRYGDVMEAACAVGPEFYFRTFFPALVEHHPFPAVRCMTRLMEEAPPTRVPALELLVMLLDHPRKDLSAPEHDALRRFAKVARLHWYPEDAPGGD